VCIFGRSERNHLSRIQRRDEFGNFFVGFHFFRIGTSSAIVEANPSRPMIW
jgi:hypothetical protein